MISDVILMVKFGFLQYYNENVGKFVKYSASSNSGMVKLTKKLSKVKATLSFIQKIEGQWIC